MSNNPTGLIEPAVKFKDMGPGSRAMYLNMIRALISSAPGAVKRIFEVEGVEKVEERLIDMYDSGIIRFIPKPEGIFVSVYVPTDCTYQEVWGED